MNADDLFSTDGSSPKIFRIDRSLQRFRFLITQIRFDGTVIERKERI